MLAWVLSAALTCVAYCQPSFALASEGGLKQSVVATGFAPLDDLTRLSETQFTTLSHPTFPNYGVRIKQTKFCDATVRAYTGYIDIGARHLFFYFFESRNDPSQDDVVLWTNGGPGCSSSVGLFMELGPCRITTNGTKFHEQSWNNRANIFFIDQPAGVGFSYASHGSVSTSEEAAEDVASFVYIFFEHFSQFKGRRFHLAGESYAGRYLPVFASYIYDQNAKLEKQGVSPINLTSVMIGNGDTHTPIMLETLYDMACTAASSVPPILGIKACVRMKQAQTRCKPWLQKSCMDTLDVMGCQAAALFCESKLLESVIEAGWNPYDITRKCDGDIGDTLCYPIIRQITAYLDRPEVRNLLGVDPSFDNRNFSSCNMQVNTDFISALDPYRTTWHNVAALLEHRVKVLLYVGKNDFGCNFIANERWVTGLDWSGKAGFGSAETKDWYVKAGTRSGSVKSYGGLSFLTVEGAGHMVPYDKPDEALWILSRWLEGEL